MVPTNEVAMRLGLSVLTVRRMFQSGKLRGVKIAGGHNWRMREADLIAAGKGPE